MTEKVFVTGATGFLGANLVKRLVAKGNEVHALIYPGTRHPFLEELPIKRFEGDILDRAYLDEAIEGCERGYHTAGLVSYRKADMEKMRAIHVDGARNVMDSSKQAGVKRVVHTSSTSTIGFTWKDIAMDEGHPWNSRYDSVGYMHTKRLGEQAALSANHHNFEVVAVNPATFFGAGDTNMNEGDLFRNIKLGKLKRAFPGGSSVVSIEDTVEGHLLAMERGKPGERYILATEYLPIREIFSIISQEVGGPEITGTFHPTNIFWMYPLTAAFERVATFLKRKTKITPQATALGFGYRHFDSGKARGELGWEPLVPFRQAVREARDFYETHKLI